MANNTEDVELRILLEKYRAAVVGLPSDVSSFDVESEIASYIQQEANRQKAELLDRLEDKIVMMYFLGDDYTKHDVVQWSAIEAERKQLKEASNG